MIGDGAVQMAGILKLLSTVFLTILESSVPSKVFELGPILQTFTEFREFLYQNDSYKAENWLNKEKKHLFLTFSQIC